MLRPMAYTAAGAPLSLKHAIDSFLLHQAAARRSVGTRQMYTRVLGAFADFLADHVGGEPTVADLLLDAGRRYVVFVQKRPRYAGHPTHPAIGSVAPATVAQHARCLRAFGHWLADEGHTPAHPFARLQVPKVPDKQPAPLTNEEVNRLLGTFAPNDPNDRRLAAMVGILFDSGMRAGELVRLRLEDLSFETGEVHVVGKTGRPLTTSDIGHLFARLRRRSGVDRLHAHLLRHTFAVHFVRNGGNQLELQRLLGHASLSTTNIYVKLASSDLVRAHQRASPLDNL